MPHRALRWAGLSILFSLGLTSQTFTEARAEEAASPLGRTIENFTLNDYRGKEWSLDDFKSNSLIVVVFLGTECPLAKLYSPRLANLHGRYEPRGVGFIGINSNRQDSITEIAAHARLHNIEFPVLKDLGNAIADRFGAGRTPEVFVLDRQRAIRYQGRIDDQYGIGYIRDEPQRQDLALALDQLLAGQRVEVPVAPSIGCHIGRVREPKKDSRVTYSSQIARILQKRCVECHREGEIAPFALTKYEEVAGWAEMIAEVVAENRMPPWHASPKYGHFANDRSLTDEEKQQIFEWVKNGAPEGDPKDLPATELYVAAAEPISRPDLEIYMSDEPFTVPAEGAVDYQYFTVDPGLKEDRWIKLADVVPGNRAVVHHILVAAQSPKGGRGMAAGGGEFIAGYVPGLRATRYPEGMAKLIPAGSKITFQVHYAPIGTEQRDRSRIVLTFADPDEVTHAVMTSRASNHRLAIPPRAENYREEATSLSLPYDVQLLSMMPHMHLRGKSFRYEMVPPKGERTVLLDVPAYDFNWQTSYLLEEPLMLPAGTRMHCVAHFDNSANNLANPDPDKRVTWGDQAWEEMMIGYFDVAVPRAAMKEQQKGAGQTGNEQQTMREHVRLMLDRYDRDGDGRISRDEIPDQGRRLFGIVDANKDGVLSQRELENLSRYMQGRK